MSITECAFLSAAVFDSPKPPSFLGPFPLFCGKGANGVSVRFCFFSSSSEFGFCSGESTASRASRMSSMVPMRVILGLPSPGEGVAPGDRAATSDAPSLCAFVCFGDANECNSPTTSSDVETSTTTAEDASEPELTDARTTAPSSDPPARREKLPSSRRTGEAPFAFASSFDSASFASPLYFGTSEPLVSFASSRASAFCFAARNSFCFLDGTPIARLIVLESVLRNDREGDLAGVLSNVADDPSSDSTEVFGLDRSAGVCGICGVRGICGETPGV